MARFTQSQAFRPSNTDDGSAQLQSQAAKAFGAFGDTLLKEHTKNRIKDAQTDAQQADFKNPTLVDNNTIYGNTFDQIVLKGHQAEVRSSMTNKLNELMVENEEDPIAFRASAEKVYKERMKEVHPNIKGITGQYFNQQIEKGFGKLRSNQMIVAKEVSETKQSQEIQEMFDTAKRDSREGKSDEIVAGQVAATIAAIHSATFLDENQKAKMEGDVIAGVFEETHIADIDGKRTAEEKYKYLDGIKDDVPDTHTVEEWDAFVSRARTRIARDKAIDEGQKVKATAEQVKLFDTVKKAKLNSLEINPDEEATARASFTPEQIVELNNIEAAMEFGVKPYKEQEAEIARIKGGVSVANTDRALKTLEVISKTRASVKKDIIGHAQASGTTEQKTFPLTDEDIAARDVESKRLAVFYNSKPKFYSEAEVLQLQAMLETRTIEEKEAFISSIAEYPHALDQVAEKGDQTYSVLAHINEKDLTTAALTGEKLVKDGSVSPDAAKTKQWWAEQSLGIYDDPANYDANYKTINSVYAYLKNKAGSDEPDSSLYEEAVTMVTGGFLETTTVTNQIFNYVGLGNDKTVIELPRGVDGETMKLYMEGFSAEMVGALGVRVQGLTDEVSARQIRESRWKNESSGQYHIIHPRYGMLRDDDEKPIIIKYSEESGELRRPVTYDEKYSAIKKKASSRKD
jgi:hypothetical protein